MDTIRSFIAIELPGEVKKDLANLQTSLKTTAGQSARWVSPENIHLTLCFLGDIPSTRVAAALEAMARTAACFHPFELHLARLGAFPNLDRPQVIFVGLQGNLVCLAELQNRLEKELQPAGYQPENRPFSPHLTLARLRPQASPQEVGILAAALSRSTSSFSTPIAVDIISLMKSRLTPNGPVYNRLGFSALDRKIVK